MIEYIVLILVILAFIIASIEDIKKREVYDYINYSLAFLVIAISIFHSVLIESIDPFKYVGFGMLVGFALGSILYYIGIWGGGDAKFLIGFSASTYYLLNFIGTTDKIHIMYNQIVEIISYLFNLFLQSFLDYMIILDIIFLSIIILKGFKTRDKEEFQGLFTLFLIIFLLFIGLYFDYSNFVLILLGVASFLLIFFGNEDSFNSVYIRVKKKILNLEEGDKIDDTLKEGNKIIVKFGDGRDGLNKEHLLKIKEQISDDRIIFVRKILPYSILVALNYVMYMLKIISLDKVNLEILGFLFKFLFFSFFAGSIIALIMLSTFFIRNYKDIEFRFNKYEKIALFILLIIVILTSLFSSNILGYNLFFLSIIFVYLFLKIAKKVELKMFVSKKEIDKVALGDWIAQDIRANGKLLYSVEDFKLGINEKQLERIKKLSKTHKDLKSIYVKDGLAFLPALLIGFIILFLL